jgi:hypothetical protein
MYACHPLEEDITVRRPAKLPSGCACGWKAADNGRQPLTPMQVSCVTPWTLQQDMMTRKSRLFNFQPPAVFGSANTPALGD